MNREFELFDNVLGIQLKCKHSSEIIVIYVVYLPPVSSKYGKLNEEILNKLTIELYRQVESEYVIICGDLNARIGDRDDCMFKP